MNTITTLIGGLAAVFALYAIGGTLRSLPPILRAILAGLIPLMGYFLLIVGRWPGLDVVAMHISVFLATGLVLFAVTQFRQRSVGRMHWVPKLLIGFFIGLAVINGSLLYIATKGLPEPIGRWWLGSDGGPVYSGFSGVVEHGQRAAKAVSSELSEAHRESGLGWQVEVSGFENSDFGGVVEVRVRDRTGLAVDRIHAELVLQRPGAVAPTLTLALIPHVAGIYQGILSVPESGRWLVTLHLVRDGVLAYQMTRELVKP